MKKLKSTLLVLLVLSRFSLNAQQKDTTDLYMEEHYSIEAGLGIQNGIIGARGKYFFSKYVGGSLGLGFFGAGFAWNAALELRHPRYIVKGISPFFNVMYGVNSGLILTAQDYERHRKTFTGVSLGVGLKFNLIHRNRTYTTLGFSHSFASSQYQKYLDEFNDKNNTFYQGRTRSAYIILSMTYCL